MKELSEELLQSFSDVIRHTTLVGIQWNSLKNHRMNFFEEIRRTTPEIITKITFLIEHKTTNDSKQTSNKNWN